MASAELTRRGFLAAGAATLALGSRRALAGEELVLSNAQILVGDGTELRGGVRIRDGRFVEVGPGVTGGADLGGGVLWPGLYEAATTLGLIEVGLEADSRDDQESSDAVLPQARVWDGYNPLSDVVSVVRARGVVGALVTPSAGCLVSGQAAWVSTRTSPDVRDVLLRAPAGVCFSLGHNARGGAPGNPASRIGVAMKLRDLFEANRSEPPEEEASAKKGKKGGAAAEPPKETAFQKALHQVLRGEQKALFFADRADDIGAALGLAEEWKLDAVIVGGAEAHLVAPRLAAAKVPVLLGPVTTQPDGFAHLHAVYENAALCHAAGVRFALRLGDDHRAYDLAVEAGIAVANGLPRAAAVAAITGAAPGLWGLDTGQIKAGQVATCVWSDGDPLQPRSSVRGLWMGGVSTPLTNRQTELYERFRVLK